MSCCEIRSENFGACRSLGLTRTDGRTANWSQIVGIIFLFCLNPHLQRSSSHRSCCEIRSENFGACRSLSLTRTDGRTPKWSQIVGIIFLFCLNPHLQRSSSHRSCCEIRSENFGACRSLGLTRTEGRTPKWSQIVGIIFLFRLNPQLQRSRSHMSCCEIRSENFGACRSLGLTRTDGRTANWSQIVGIIFLFCLNPHLQRLMSHRSCCEIRSENFGACRSLGLTRTDGRTPKWSKIVGIIFLFRLNPQ